MKNLQANYSILLRVGTTVHRAPSKSVGAQSVKIGARLSRFLKHLSPIQDLSAWVARDTKVLTLRVSYPLNIQMDQRNFLIDSLYECFHFAFLEFLHSLDEELERLAHDTLYGE